MGSRNAQFRERGIGAALLAPVLWLARVAFVGFGLLVAAWFVDAVFVYHVWPEGIARLREVLDQDLARAAALGGEGGRLVRLAAGAANGLYAGVFELTGLHAMGLTFAGGAPLSIPDTITRSAYLAHWKEIEVAMVGTQILGVRLALLAAGVSFGALVYAVAVADGVVQRAIRRGAGGRESSGLYHRAKYLQIVLAASTLALGLLLPVSVDPRWVWISGPALMAMVVRLQVQYYKKHL